MATRSNIIANLNEVWHCIYCHFDGYPRHMGPLLLSHYRTPEALAALMELGDLSTLDASPSAPPAEHSFAKPIEGFCVAYHRDRGDAWLDAQPAKSMALADVWPNTNGAIEWVYVHHGNHWTCAAMPCLPDDPRRSLAGELRDAILISSTSTPTAA
jgi:hypothetical protein